MIFAQVRDDYSDIMTIEEFEECVKCGSFIPDDGSGYYGTETHYNYLSVWSYIAPKGATHVHWYNK